MTEELVIPNTTSPATGQRGEKSFHAWVLSHLEKHSVALADTWQTDTCSVILSKMWTAQPTVNIVWTSQRGRSENQMSVDAYESVLSLGLV